jgi:hypothetical protein
MTSNGNPRDPPSVVRRVASPAAAALVAQVETFEELQTVLRCCERLVTELAAEEPDDVVLEGVWTMALLSYARCFTDAGGTALTEEDLTTAQPTGDVLEWHRVLLRVRDHHADPAVNPRERFSVGVAETDEGTAGGVAITSVRQPAVDDLTVRQTGAVAYALSGLVDERIQAGQLQVYEEMKGASRADLESLERLDVVQS